MRVFKEGGVFPRGYGLVWATTSGKCGRAGLLVWVRAGVVSFVVIPTIVAVVALKICGLFRLFIYGGREVVLVRGVSRQKLLPRVSAPGLHKDDFSFSTLGVKYLLTNVKLKLLLNCLVYCTAVPGCFATSES